MEFKISRANFRGYGVFISSKSLYVCAKLDIKSKAGIRLLSHSDRSLIEYIEFKEEWFYGNVVCFEVFDFKFKSFLYDFCVDDIKVLDDFAREITSDGEFCVAQVLGANKAFDNDKCINRGYEDSVFYLTDIRSFTMLDPSAKEFKGTFKAAEKRITYLKNLGITALMLMPLYELKPIKNDDYKAKAENKKPNLWGFGDGYYYSVKKSLAHSGNSYLELKDFICKLHKNGIEFVPIFNFDRDMSYEDINSILSFWLFEFHADGFRLIGSDLPIKDLLLNPLYSKTKIICDNFDFADFSPKYKYFGKNLACMDNSYMNNSRRFLKSDEDMVSYMSYAVRENHKYYSVIRNITDFSGFTLNDLVSYNVKNNMDNGENNTDGTDYNYSWNCGIEGPTKKKSVLDIRKKQLRNAMILTCLSQGTPLIKGGDELLNTQYGNNNPYCQDNETGWIKYRKDIQARDFLNFTKNLLAFRKRHIILHQPKELMMFDYMSCMIPDVSFHGSEAFKLDQTPFSRAFSVLYCGDYSKQYSKEKEESILIAYNMYWGDCDFALPYSAKGVKWKLLYSTDGSTNETFLEEEAITVKEDYYKVKGRSIAVFIAEDLTALMRRSKL